MSFFHYFFNINSAREEVAVCCPFPHYTPGAKIPYFETNASAHVNTVENVFHCKVCGEGYNELSFIRRILGCTYANAIRLAQVFHKTDEEDYLDWQENMKLTDTTRAQLHELGINDETIEELSIRSTRNDEIVFPVFMYNKLLDIRKYVPGGTPKVASRSGAIPGLIIPYDVWRNDPRHVTLICAGEKDMAVARSHGFNAITLTGGENMLPALLTCFKDKRLVIVYDNDGAGIDGANKLAAFLKPYAKTIKNCTAFHEVCSGPKEDITDFFTKYGKTKADLVKYIQQTPEFVIAPEMQVTHPTMTLHEATNPNHVGKMVRSNIQVVATSEVTFIIPQTLIGEKTNDPSEGDSGKMFKGEIREWNLTESTIQDVLHMMDNNFTLDALNKNYRRILGIMEKEKHVRIRKGPKEILHKCYVTDMFETANTEVVPMEYLAYSIGTKLESGKKYLATYKLVPHPYRGQQLVMLITSAEQANDSVSNFVITDKVKKDLDIFRNLEGTVEERINEHADRFKDILGYNGNNLLIQTIDLAYHTVLEFDFGQFKNIRGYLDTIIVGESRMGKSSTAEAMRKTYGLGTITSLAGNAATVPGLVGGSNKVGNSYQTRAGVIPQNHKGLIIFEEFGKSNGNIVKELTDIRSSNEVRITRVSGTLTLPALVRMIALTNVCTSDGNIRSIASYPNGITILTDLIGQEKTLHAMIYPLSSEIEDIVMLTPFGHHGNLSILQHSEQKYDGSGPAKVLMSV
jgi:DNA primase